MKRKLFAVMTSLCLLVAAFPLSVFADDAQYQEVDVDGSVSTDLNYSFEYVPQGNEFVISIPTSLSWAGDSEGEFSISLAPQSTIAYGFNVSVYVSPDSFTNIGGTDCIKLTSGDGSNYIGFTLANTSLHQVYSSTDNRVAYFEENGNKEYILHFNRVATQTDRNNGEYTGSMTFNIESCWM